MADTPDYSWPPMESRKVMGKPFKRLDGPAKATGRAKYSSDLKPRDLLYAVYVHSPHAHARVTSVDTSDAEKSAGVKAVHVAAPAGTEVQCQGWEIAAVAATTEQAARVAAGRIQVGYEVLPHLVKDDDLSKATGRTKQGGEKVVGDPDKTFQERRSRVRRQVRNPDRQPLLPGTSRCGDSMAGRQGLRLALDAGRD